MGTIAAPERRSWFRRVVARADEVLARVVGVVRPRWPLALVLLLSAAVVLGRIDMALAGNHTLGALAGGYGDLTSPLRLLTPGTGVEIVHGWDDPGGFLSAYLLLDLLLMTLVAVFLVIARAVTLEALAGDVPDDPVETAYRPPARQALAWSGLAIVGYWGADVVETVGTYLLVSSGTYTAITAQAVGALSALKMASIVLALVPLALVGTGFGSLRRGALSGLGALRGNVIVGVVLVLLFLSMGGDIGRQIDDVFVHAAQSPVRAGLATVLAVLTSWVMLRGGMRCLAAYRTRPEVRPVSQRLLVVTAVGALALVLLGMLLPLVPALGPLRASATALLVVPGLALLVWSALSWPPMVRALRLPEDVTPGQPSTVWVWVLAALPVLLLWLGLLRAGTTAVAMLRGWPPAGLLVWAVVLGALVGLYLWRSRGPRLYVATEPGWVEVWSWLGVAALTLGLSALVPATFWMGVGTLGVLVWFALVTTLGLTGLTLLGDRLPPRGALAITRVRRSPVILGLVLWALVASVLDTDGRYHDVDLVPVADGAATPVSAPAALGQWLTAGPGAGGDRSLVFVASSGGGIRAAYWTQIVWECAFADRCAPGRADRTQEVFFASGVSGGAVGLALVAANQTSDQEPEVTFAHDFLAPAVAALFARDLPNAVARLPLTGWDRSAALGQAFELAEPKVAAPMSTVAGHAPYLSLNGTSVEDGCRFALSTIQQASTRTACEGVLSELPGRGPGASPVRQGNDYLCDRDGVARDVSLATSALLSARFPFVSPTGSLRDCAGHATFVLDGGMFDNSGGSSVSNALSAIGPALERANTGGDCVIPRLLVVDNTFASTARPSSGEARPMQTLGPGAAVGAFYGNRSDRELAAAARAVEAAATLAKRQCGSSDDLADVVTIHPVAAGGASAPLGWTLAGSTQATMLAQLPLLSGTPETPSASPGAERIRGSLAGGVERPVCPAGATRRVLSAQEPSPSRLGREEHLDRMCASIRTVHAWLP